MRVSAVMPVREAAARLEVTPSRIRAMIHAGLLDAEKIGDRWLVDRDSVDRRRAQEYPSGRPMKPSNAWGLLSLTSGEGSRVVNVLGRLSPWSRSRVRSRLRSVGLRSTAARLHGRAVVRRFRAHPSDLARIAEEPGIVRSGVSAAADYDLDIAAPGVLEAYVPADQLPNLQRNYGFEPSGNPNLILHVADEPWPFSNATKVVPPAVAALDLMEADDTRSRRAGEELLKRLESR